MRKILVIGLFAISLTSIRGIHVEASEIRKNAVYDVNQVEVQNNQQVDTDFVTVY